MPAEAAEANVKWYSMRFQWCQIGRTAFYDPGDSMAFLCYCWPGCQGLGFRARFRA